MASGSQGESPFKSPANGFVATTSVAATKTDTPIIETPQSLSVVTSDEIRDRQSETLSQTLDLTPGFTSQPTSFNRTSDRFRIRGTWWTAWPGSWPGTPRTPDG